MQILGLVMGITLVCLLMQEGVRITTGGICRAHHWNKAIQLLTHELSTPKGTLIGLSCGQIMMIKNGRAHTRTFSLNWGKLRSL